MPTGVEDVGAAFLTDGDNSEAIDLGFYGILQSMTPFLIWITVNMLNHVTVSFPDGVCSYVLDA